ncbi:MAG: hypothetical protein ACE5HM_05840 [Acidiferrobacterales bacterium]
MQLRFQTGHTSAEYVSGRVWQDASLPRCPNHPYGGCSFARHGTYERKTPPGTHVARWYCPDSHMTFSLLPDCLAARLPGSLNELEAVVAVAEQASSLEAAADQVRRDHIALPGAIRWVRRRIAMVQRCLLLVIGLLPEQLSRCPAEIGAVRARLATPWVLMSLREHVAAQLPALPSPVGFSPHGSTGGDPNLPRQHKVGPDPPT